MAPKKTLFIAPTRESPPTGPIALGNIIKDPRSPELPLIDSSSAAVASLAASYQQVTETGVLYQGVRGFFMGGGLVAKFLEGMPFDLGPTVGGSHGHGITSKYEIDRLVSQSIYPTMDDVRKVFNEPSVQEAIKNSFFRANIYMITSVHVAYGADVLIPTLKNHGFHLHLRADLTPGQLPFNAGVGGALKDTNNAVQRSRVEADTPFVLAYRLREISYIRKKVRGQAVYENGDLYGIGDRKEEQVQDEPENFVAELVVMDDENPDLPELWDMAPSDFILIDSDPDSDDSE